MKLKIAGALLRRNEAFMLKKQINVESLPVIDSKNKIQVFENNEFGELEVLTIGDKPYFPAKVCAAILGYKDTIKRWGF
jgi:hypothetical protein